MIFGLCRERTRHTHGNCAAMGKLFFRRFTITVILFILPYFTEKEKPVFLN